LEPEADRIVKSASRLTRRPTDHRCETPPY
jgi:hypothetical protein